MVVAFSNEICVCVTKIPAKHETRATTVQLSLLDAFNEQYIQGGDLACGTEPPQFSESDSSGKFKIKDEELEPLCFVTKHDIDGMCGDMVQLSGSDGTVYFCCPRCSFSLVPSAFRRFCDRNPPHVCSLSAYRRHLRWGPRLQCASLCGCVHILCWV